MSSRKSESKSSNSWLSEDDEAFFQEHLKKRFADMQHRMPPIKVVEDFLSTTKLPYAIIGGKAAKFHLEHTTAASPNEKALALETEDYDILVDKKNGAAFVEALQHELNLKSIVELSEQKHESKEVDIILMGVTTKDGVFTSIVDVHILKGIRERLPTTVKDKNGLKYANIDWICAELADTLQNYSSDLEIKKAVKRYLRQKLLKCLNKKKTST